MWDRRNCLSKRSEMERREAYWVAATFIPVCWLIYSMQWRIRMKRASLGLFIDLLGFISMSFAFALDQMAG